MDKKKIIWVAGALTVTGLTAYAIFHNCKRECFICRHRGLTEAFVFAGAGILGWTFRSWMMN